VQIAPKLSGKASSRGSTGGSSPLLHHCLMPEHRYPFPGGSSIVVRATTQFGSYEAKHTFKRRLVHQGRATLVETLKIELF
jgi:hypothetical protein